MDAMLTQASTANNLTESCHIKYNEYNWGFYRYSKPEIIMRNQASGDSIYSNNAILHIPERFAQLIKHYAFVLIGVQE
jgi:hypothetical protein